jgi:MFS family permease
MNRSPHSLSAKLTLMANSMLTIIATAAIAPALPVMRNHFAATDNVDYLVRLVLTMPSLCVAIVAPLTGLILDQVGRKPVLAIALLIYGFAGSSGLWLNSLGLLLLGRALVGLSVAGILTAGTTLIADYYTGSTRTRWLGFQAAAMSLGGAVVLPLSGILATISWRTPFFLFLMALILLPLVLALLPEPNRAKSSAPSQNLLEPVNLPIDLVILTYTIAFLTQAMFFIIPVQLPFYLQFLINATPTQSGLALAIATLFGVLSSLIHQKVKAHLTFIRIYEIAYVSMGAGFGLIGLASNLGVVLLGLAMAGFGLGLIFPNMNLCLTAISPGMLRGRVLGGLATCSFLGQFISLLFSQPLSHQIGLNNTYGLAGIVLIAIAIVTVAVMSRHKQLA